MAKYALFNIKSFVNKDSELIKKVLVVYTQKINIILFFNLNFIAIKPL